MYPEELRISYSRSLWSTEPVPRWTGEPHQCPQLLYLGLGRRPSGIPETFCWSVSHFQGQMDKEKGTRWSERGGGRVPLPILPAPHLGTPGTCSWANFLARVKV